MKTNLIKLNLQKNKNGLKIASPGIAGMNPGSAGDKLINLIIINKINNNKINNNKQKLLKNNNQWNIIIYNYNKNIEIKNIINNNIIIQLLYKIINIIQTVQISRYLDGLWWS